MNSSIGGAHLQILELPPLLGLGGGGKGAAGGSLVDFLLKGPVGVRRRHEVEHGAAQRRGRCVGARDDLERDFALELFAADAVSDEGALRKFEESVRGQGGRHQKCWSSIWKWVYSTHQHIPVVFRACLEPLVDEFSC